MRTRDMPVSNLSVLYIHMFSLLREKGLMRSWLQYQNTISNNSHLPLTTSRHRTIPLLNQDYSQRHKDYKGDEVLVYTLEAADYYIYL